MQNSIIGNVRIDLRSNLFGDLYPGIQSWDMTVDFTSIVLPSEESIDELMFDLEIHLRRAFHLEDKITDAKI